MFIKIKRLIIFLERISRKNLTELCKNLVKHAKVIENGPKKISVFRKILTEICKNIKKIWNFARFLQNSVRILWNKNQNLKFLPPPDGPTKKSDFHKILTEISKIIMKNYKIRQGKKRDSYEWSLASNFSVFRKILTGFFKILTK